jgi:geranylgeranyl pyrophosphate synthase
VDLDQLEIEITKNLRSHLKSSVSSHSFSKVYDYALFPVGKLFRPKLVRAISADLTNTPQSKLDSNSQISVFSSFIEIHHTYTLIHDDLPAMDNDDYRRGRESTHKKFGEWQAILAGDGLLNLSYGLLGNIESDKLPQLLRLCHWCLGNKGLIQGQVLDLSNEMNNSFTNLILTHQLKTARLIQLSLIGGALLSPAQDSSELYNISKKLFRLGHSIGVSFQLLDDLTELTEIVSGHEKNINPWLNYFNESNEYLLSQLGLVNNSLLQQNYKNTLFILKNYFFVINSKLENGEELITQQLGKNSKYLDPIMSSLKRLSSL